jgi:hypothetical protein
MQAYPDYSPWKCFVSFTPLRSFFNYNLLYPSIRLFPLKEFPQLFIYFQPRQLPEHLWNSGNLISTNPKISQIGQLPERLWNKGNLIVIEAKLCQIGQLPECLWDRGNLIVMKPKVCQIGQLSERLWNEGNLIVTEAKHFQIR